MSRSQKWKDEWAFFLGDTDRRRYADLCRRCIHDCKQSFRAEVIVHTPLKKCSLTADDGASPPLKWCTNSAEMVHGGRRRGARGRHAGNHSGMPLRLRMDSPSIWMV